MREFQKHLQELISKMPSQAWLWHFVVPLTASALLLTSYTPGSHCKSRMIYQSTIWLIGVDFLPLLVFNALFADACRTAIYDYTIHEDVQQKFVSAIREEMEALFAKMVSQPAMESALLTHHQ